MNTAEKKLGLYLHIPFCRQKCVYCDFYSLAGSESRMDEYMAEFERNGLNTISIDI